MQAHETKTVHLWLPDGRSLCDRHARPTHRGPVRTLDEFDAQTAEDQASPACGPCMLLIEHLRGDAAAILATQPGVSPTSASDAWATLEDTRWNQRLNLAEFAKTPDVDARTRFDAVLRAVDPGHVDEIVAHQRAALDARREVVRNYWDQHDAHHLLE